MQKIINTFKKFLEFFDEESTDVSIIERINLEAFLIAMKSDFEQYQLRSAVNYHYIQSLRNALRKDIQAFNIDYSKMGTRTRLDQMDHIRERLEKIIEELKKYKVEYDKEAKKKQERKSTALVVVTEVYENHPDENHVT